MYTYKPSKYNTWRNIELICNIETREHRCLGHAWLLKKERGPNSDPIKLKLRNSLAILIKAFHDVI